MPTPITFPDQIWAGTEHSLILASEAFQREMAAGPQAASLRADTQEDEPPEHFQLHGNIGIIQIKGPLTNRDSWTNFFYGVTSYADIRRSLVYAANHPEVKMILLDVDSGGGSVAGVADTANLIKSIDKIKPTYAITDGAMASAAYWLSAGARKIFISGTAVMGSIGVIATHMEYSKQLKEAGIGVTVVRAGKYKALVNSFEPLTETAMKQLSELLDGTYKVFIGWVADQRKVSVNQADERMGQGREFLGEAAVAAGLADGVATFDSLISQMTKQLDKEVKPTQNSLTFQRGAEMPKSVLTEQQVAAIAAGLPVEQVQETPEPAAVVTPPAEDTPAPAAEVTEPKTEKPSADVVAFLQGQIKDKDAELLSAKVELQQVKAKVASIEANHQGLFEIVATSVSTMKVALGFSKLDLTGMTTEQLLAEHKATGTQFAAAFKVGGVAAVTAAEEPKVEAAAQEPHRQRRIDATRI